MNALSIRSRLVRAGAVVVVANAVGIAGAMVAAADQEQQAPADVYQENREAVAEWARANDLRGLSPASLSAND